MEALRHIPPVNDILRAPELVAFCDHLGTPMAARIIDEVTDEVRQELLSGGKSLTRAQLTTRIAKTVAERMTSAMSLSMRRVINASGVVLHTNLGRAPLPIAALEHLKTVAAGYSNLEFSLDEGTRSKRDVHAERLLQELLGCEAAIVVNNNAAAVLLVLSALGEGGEVVASRGEQVEIGGSFRIPEVMAKSGAYLREVGTTNRTRIQDYEQAIGERTRLLLRVHPSNFRMIGFTERAALEELVDLGRRRSIPTFEDLGSGCVLDPEPLGITGEPVAQDSIQAGVDVISFSGDKLLGGPQAGIIAGKRKYIDQIRKNPLFRALRVDKLTIAVLESILMTYIRGDIDDIPIWRMLRASEDGLRVRAESFAHRAGPITEAIPLASVVGGGSAPETYLPSWGVVLRVEGKSDTELEAMLRESTPPVVARIDDGHVVLDFRTVFPEEEEELLRVIAHFER